MMPAWAILLQLALHAAPAPLRWEVWSTLECAERAAQVQRFTLFATPSDAGWHYARPEATDTPPLQWYVETAPHTTSVLRAPLFAELGWPPHFTPPTEAHASPMVFGVRAADGALQHWQVAWKSAATSLDDTAACATATGEIRDTDRADPAPPLGTVRCCAAHDARHTFCRYLAGEVQLSSECHLQFVAVQS